MDDALEVGDRVTLKRWYLDSIGDLDRDKEFGLLSEYAIGTITWISYGSSVVLWDDPSFIAHPYCDQDTKWSEGWFNKVGRLDVSAPDKIEAFLNGR